MQGGSPHTSYLPGAIFFGSQVAQEWPVPTDPCPEGHLEEICQHLEAHFPRVQSWCRRRTARPSLPRQEAGEGEGFPWRPSRCLPLLPFGDAHMLQGSPGHCWGSFPAPPGREGGADSLGGASSHGLSMCAECGEVMGRVGDAVGTGRPAGQGVGRGQSGPSLPSAPHSLPLSTSLSCPTPDPQRTVPGSRCGVGTGEERDGGGR